MGLVQVVTVSQQEIIEQAINSIKSHHHLLGSDVVDLSVAALEQQRDRLRRSSSPFIDQNYPDRYQSRTVTVLAAALSNFSALHAGTNGDMLNKAINQVWLELERIVQHWGGVVIERRADKLEALFGLDDDADAVPQQAVRAALSMQAALALWPHQESVRPDDRLQIRIGLHTGKVAVNAGDNQQIEVQAGSTVRMARQLEEMAPVGTPLLSYEMHQAAAHHMGYHFDVEPVILPGLSDENGMVTTFRTIAYLVTGDKVPDFWQHLRSNGMIPHLIGREAEHEQLQRCLEQVVEQRQAHLVTVMGGLGYGKSHLLYHFEQWLSLAPVSLLLLRGQVRASRQQWPTPPLGDVVADLLGLRLYDSKQVLQNKIRAGLRGYLPETAVSEAATVMEKWLGLDNGEGTRYSPAEWLMVLIRLLPAIMKPPATAQSRPVQAVVLLLEDLHEADELAINFVEALFRQCRDLPLLLIGSARPTLRTKRPSWPTDVPADQHTLLKLTHLSAIETRHVANAFLPQFSPPPAKLYELLVARAKGMPLYIREAVRLLQLEGRLKIDEPLWSVSQLDAISMAHIKSTFQRDRPVGLLPESLPVLFQQQLTTVSPEARAVLQGAAAVGNLFWDTAVAHLLDQSSDSSLSEVKAVLQTLAVCGFIRRQPLSMYRRARAYTFSHPLLRRILLERISPQQRHDYQSRLAEWQQQHESDYQGVIQLPDSAAGPISMMQHQPIPGSVVDPSLRNR
jgi:class 3 adenylate cyclase